MSLFVKFLLIFSIFVMANCAFANDGCINTISIPGIDNTCHNSLSFAEDIDGSPFFVKDPNGLCGIGLSLPGLPNISFNGLKVHFNIEKLFCSLLKGPIMKSVFDL